MQIKQILSAVMGTVIFLSGLHFAIASYATNPLPTGLRGWGVWADSAVTHTLNDYSFFTQLAPNVMRNIGIDEQDGIFITENYLLENIRQGDPELLEYNISQIQNFVHNNDVRTSFMLIPTAVAIKQQLISSTAPIYNQKALINEVYATLSSSATLIDCYSSLFSAHDQYTYYRTASNLTSLGGYYVYTSIANRLGLDARGLNQFEIEHLATNYYGDLYERCSYKGSPADIVALYEFRQFDRKYKVEHTDGDETKAYYSIFQRHLEHISNPTDVILGGFSPRIDISIVSPFDSSLLIFGDETVISYLPFLMVHYSNITFISLSSLSESEIIDFSGSDYDNVLFAYSVDSFLNDNVCKNADMFVL